MKNLKKEILTNYGTTANFWVATRLEAVLYNRNAGTAAAQPGIIEFTGWANKEAHDNGAEPMKTLRVRLNDISTLQSYVPVVTELLGTTIQNPTSQLVDAEIEEFVYPQPDPQPEPEE